MKEELKSLLSKIEEAGFEAYLVGGYPRDFLLGRKTDDYDICTNASLDFLKQLPLSIQEENLNSLKVIYQGIPCEITTYRQELSYYGIRTPVIEKASSLEEDIQRRDFTINTLCMNQKGEIIDLLHGKEDLENRILKSVGNPQEKLREDPLRILRAIRFASTYQLQIEDTLSKAILEEKARVQELSFYRKKEELEKLWKDKNALTGISLLHSYGFDDFLECHLEVKKWVAKKEFLWAQIHPSQKYPFSRQERREIDLIKEILSKEKLTSIDYYSYDKELLKMSATFFSMTAKEVEKKIQELPIHSRKEIALSSQEIISLTGKHPSIVYPILEEGILLRQVENQKEHLLSYLTKYFSISNIE